MGGGSLSTAGLVRLREVITGHVHDGTVPGVVVELARGGDVHVDAVGNTTVDGREPMLPDALFRITSMTRPVTAVATLLLVQDGRLSLDEPVDRLLSELADRRVLRRLDGPVDDTVAAHRPITVRDLLTFRMGMGVVLAPAGTYPIQDAIRRSRIGVGPPAPDLL